jgi:hypothetical protein
MKKLLTLPALLLLIVMSFITGCKDDCTECCDTITMGPFIRPSQNTSPFVEFTGLNPLQSGVIYYYYLGGTPQRVQFFMGNTTDDICTDEHLTIYYKVNTFNDSPTRPIKIIGEVYWSIFSDEVILWNDITGSDQTYLGNISDVGLKQAFPEGAATIDVYLTAEFESLGSFAGDTAFFTDHFTEFYSEFSYKRF